MKSTSAPGPFARSLIASFLLLALAPAAVTSAQPTLQPSASHGPAPQPRPASAAGCQWTYYPISGGHLQPQQLLYNDPDNTPIVNLSVGNMFKGKATPLSSTGSTDFNGDGKTDVFRTTPRNDGNLQWQYSSGGAGAWQNLAYAGPELPTSALQFGQFTGVTKTDVFANENYGGAYHWDYSLSGLVSFHTLNSSQFYPDRLALGDFNGDGVTDVFTATPQNNTEQWGYFPGGSGGLVNLAHAGTDPALLRFGDFNGDGHTDVFAATQLPDGSTPWVYSSGGAASYTHLVTSTVPYSELQFGDFNGDGQTDVLAALPQADGGRQVIYWPGGLGPGVTLGHIPAPAPALRVGDFNGDGISDLLALRCGMPGPLAFGPLQTLATSGYNTFQRVLAGDVNGDGRSDLILVSTCQNPNAFDPNFCATYHLQVGATLGTPALTDIRVPPQTLSTGDFEYSRMLVGDFDGNGKTDLAVVEVTSPTLTITVGLSNGNGTFTLASPQVFGNEDWNQFNPVVGDFNGDGKADLAFTTVCYIAYGSCTVGDINRVRVATSTGGGAFDMGARVDLNVQPVWGDYYAFAGDFNGDGKTDLVFNSTCEKTTSGDSTCTAGQNNLVYTALSDGAGSFTLGALQNFGGGWSDYFHELDLVGDVNGDGRSDLVWSASAQYSASGNNLVVVGLANANGTFQLGPTQNLGSAWSGSLTLADLNGDRRADLLWNNTPLGNTDVDTYAAATSNGNGTFTSQGPGAVYTGQGNFQMPTVDPVGKLPTGLTLVSGRQDSISNALFVIRSLFGVFNGQSIYLPLVRK